MSVRVLVIDDEPDLIGTYKIWLEEEGYEVRGAGTASGGLELVDAWRPHVVLLDQKLKGSMGRDTGLSLLRQIADRFPPARLIMVTAYASREAVVRAFSEGATDYLEKRDILEPLLRVKVREAAMAAEHAMEGMNQAASEAALREVWAQALVEQNSQRKGALLEQAIRRLMESVPGFAHARSNVRNEIEEIDVLVTNRSSDPLLSRQGDFIVVECKNWKTNVGTEVIDRLRGKVGSRYGRSKLGICVSVGGFASTVKHFLIRAQESDLLFLLLDKDGIQSWIDAPDRSEWLVGQISEAVV